MRASFTTAVLFSVIAMLQALGCAAQSSGSATQAAPELVRVDASSIVAMPSGQTYAIDLRRNAVFEIDGAKSPLDVARVVVTRPNGETSTLDVMVDQAYAHGAKVDTIRLSGDPSALGAFTGAPSVGSVNPQLWCSSGACLCKGDDDCNEMYSHHCGGKAGGVCVDSVCGCW